MKRRLKILTIYTIVLGCIISSTSGAMAKEKYVEIANKNCVECHIDQYYVENDFFMAETFSKWYYQMWALSLTAFIFLLNCPG